MSDEADEVNDPPVPPAIAPDVVGFNAHNIRDHIKTEIETVLSERVVPSAPPAPAVQAADNRSTYEKVNEWLEGALATIRQRLREPLFVLCIFGVFFIANLVASRFNINMHLILTKSIRFGMVCYMVIMLFQVMGDAGHIFRRR